MSTLPYDDAAEKTVLGAVLLSSRTFVEVCDLLRPEDFYHPAHGAIYEAMLDLDGVGTPIDAITLAARMQTADTFHKLRAVGGEGYFAELTSAVVTIENCRWHAGLVAGRAMLRRIAEVCDRARLAVLSGEHGDPREFADATEVALYAATDRQHSNPGELVRTILGRAFKAIEQRYKSGQVVTGVPSGFTRLDAMTAGFQPGDLVIIAARPSMGKTSLVMNAVQNAAIEFGVPALVFSLEMSKESLVERMAAAEGQIDSMRLRSGLLEQRDWIALSKAAGRIAEAPIVIDDTSSPTLSDIRARARRWRSAQVRAGYTGLAAIVVDYLQLIGSTNRETTREREIAEISRGLKSLAKELRVPVIALSQLNRAVESRADKRPGLGDLRESGAIEQDADVIAFIYRDEVYNADSPDKGTAEVIIGKQRTGPVGTVRLKFLNEYTRFENLAEDRD